MLRITMAIVVVFGLAQASFAGQKCVTVAGKKVCVNLNDKKADGDRLSKDDIPSALEYIMAVLDEVRQTCNNK